MSLQEQAANQAVLNAEEEALKELSNKIVYAAIADGASDIHIDPASKETKVRFRIDGVMHEIFSLPKNVHGPLSNRFKVMGDLDTENRRTIQDGRFIIEKEGTEFDVREAVLPSVWGEKLTMRILPQQSELPTLERMGISDHDRKRLDKALISPMGMIIFAGPSGSGKTTTMYGALQQLIQPELNVLTVEDPVEVRLPGVTQVHVNRKVNMTFASILRGMMRCDPDIIMVGNMPDLETAETAFQASMTGHLLLTQLHAMDAPNSIQRLFDMGVEPFLVSQSLFLSAAQRLVRRVCSNCQQEVEYPEKVVNEVLRRAAAEGMKWPEGRPVFHKGRGCDKCHNAGYYGRTGLYEFMPVATDDEVANLVAVRASVEEIRAAAIRNGMTTMLADGIHKVLEGRTTLEEVTRVLRVSI